MPKLDLDSLFKPRTDNADSLQKKRLIRIAAKDFAKVIQENTPESAGQTLAIRKAIEAMSQANEAINVNESENQQSEFQIEVKNEFRENLRKHDHEIERIVASAMKRGRERA